VVWRGISENVNIILGIFITQSLQILGEAKPEVVRPLIPFEACLEMLLETTDVPDFYSSAAQRKTYAKKTVRTKNFPDFMLFHLMKFAVDDHWVPYKLDVEVPMPDEIDLSR
jgi:ubiquitin carboxyl-terminal hydrolase 5/13